MTKLIFRIIAIILFLSSVNVVLSQHETNSDSIYYARNYYLCKVWGYVKYFHSEVAKGNINWDDILIQTIQEVNNSSSDHEFNVALLNMINAAGLMVQPTSTLPLIPDSLKFNLDINWFQDSILSNEVRAALDTIRVRFRPQNNYYVEEYFQGGNPSFKTDNQYYSFGENQYPAEEYRLLALFRYWNIINYFYPYKNIIDQDWDSTLVEFIPKFVNSHDAWSYHMTFLELSTKINDSHANTSSQIINEDIIGYYYFPINIQYIENETVITKVLQEGLDLQVGDIIKSINGSDIYSLRESIKYYTHSSNPSSLERNVNYRILSGRWPINSVNIVVENEHGPKEIMIPQNIYYSKYLELIENEGLVWKIINTNNGNYGYVDMGRLEKKDIPYMFSGLWETDGIIFDIRNYPKGTMWYMINYLFDSPIHIAKFTVPAVKYPGILEWMSETVGFGDFSKTYKKEIYILFNELTQSQAEYTIMALEQHPKSIKIGSQTAGADGNISRIYLPGGIVTSMTGLGVFYPDYTETQRIGIVPDIEVYPTIAGIRDGRDELLERALNLTSDEFDFNENSFFLQNYPNPFNTSTTIEFQITRNKQITIKIYDILGRHIYTLIEGYKSAGYYKLVWDGLNAQGLSVGSGVYIISYQSDNEIYIKKLVLIR